MDAVRVVTPASYRQADWEAFVHLAADADAGFTLCGTRVAELATRDQAMRNRRCRRCDRIAAKRA